MLIIGTRPVLHIIYIFYSFALTWPDFWKMFYTVRKKAHFLKKSRRTSIDVARSDEKVSRIWLGRGNEVARTPPLLELSLYNVRGKSAVNVNAQNDFPKFQIYYLISIQILAEGQRHN